MRLGERRRHARARALTCARSQGWKRERAARALFSSEPVVVQKKKRSNARKSLGAETNAGAAANGGRRVSVGEREGGTDEKTDALTKLEDKRGCHRRERARGQSVAAAIVSSRRTACSWRHSGDGAGLLSFFFFRRGATTLLPPSVARRSPLLSAHLLRGLPHRARFAPMSPARL
jgi:hypothetical protein